MDVYFEKINPDASIPQYKHPGDAGMDVTSCADIVIRPGQTCIVPTGLKVAVPEGYELQVRARSGVSLKTPLRVANGVGTVDSGYRGEVGIIIHNTSPAIYGLRRRNLSDKGPGTYMIKKGDRIAQLVLNKYEQICVIPCEDVSAIGSDRGGGFGSTGVK